MRTIHSQFADTRLFYCQQTNMEGKFAQQPLGESSSANFSVDMTGSEDTTYKSSSIPPPYDSPSKYAPSPDEFQFMQTSNADTSTSQLSGAMENRDPEEDRSLPTVRHRGTAGKYLDKKGFGWLLDVDDDDEEHQKPLLEELDIDIKDIYYKLRCVLLPLPFLKFNRSVVRDNPDFWGPLVVVLVYSLVSLIGQFRVVSWILTIWVFGTLLIFLLARVLGGEVTYSQCLGVIGYSLLPLVITGFMLPLFRSMHYLGMAFKMFGVVWAAYSAGSLLCVDELRQKRPLLLYPILLLFIYFLSLHTGA